MDWKACAIDDLRRYPMLKLAIRNCREKIRAVQGIAQKGRMAFEEGIKAVDSRYVDAIVEVDKLRYNLESAERLAAVIERALSVLDDEERLILTKFFMSDDPANIIELRNRLSYESRTIYRRKDKALLKFTLAMYGVDVS